MQCPNCGSDVPLKKVKYVPDEYKPLSAWAYFGYQLLFAIPIVGFVLLIVFSCGGARNRNLRNFARSYWCGLLIVAIVAIIAVVIALLLGLFTAETISSPVAILPPV